MVHLTWDQGLLLFFLENNIPAGNRPNFNATAKEIDRIRDIWTGP